MLSQSFIGGMHVRTRNAKEPRSVLFYIHGLGESGLCLEYIMRNPLLSDYSHIAPDLLGYGKSPWPENPLHIPEYAHLLAGWLSRQGIDQVVLVGHSLGGVIGTFFCEAYPEKVRLFINIEGNASLEDCTISSCIFAHELDVFVREGFGKYCDEIYEKGLKEKSLRTYYASLRMCDPRSIFNNSRELVELSAGEDLGRRLGALACPSFYIWGSPGGTQSRSLDLINKAGVPLVEIENAGHWPFIDNPSMFGEKVLRILDENII